jgi:lincosamide nucleotidyltransferase A/C/D/E
MEVRDVLEILDTLAGAGVRSWLAGGWGVDALAGRRTRDHKDLDLVVDRADAPAAGAALRARGFVLLPGTVPGAERSVPDALMPDREVFRDAAGRTVDVHPVDVGEWPAGIRPAFAAGQVGGRAVDCISPAAQAAAHRGYEVHAAHAGDLALIERLLAPASDPA